MRPLIACTVLLAMAASTAGAARDKLDVVRVRNGDRITCEVIELQAGRLQAKTASLGTVQIDWQDVMSIESPHSFYFELVNGDRHSGRPGPAARDGRVTVIEGDRVTEVELAQIAHLAQEEVTFGGRIRGSASLGFDHVRATDTTVLNFGLDAEYRSGARVTDLSLDLSATDSSDEGPVDVGQITLFRQWLRSRGYFTFGLGAAERNEAQGVDARVLLGGGVGRYLLRTDQSELAIFGGVAGVEEWLAGAESAHRTSSEALAGLRGMVYRFGDPETTLTSRLLLFPSLTESGRFRARLDTSLRRELVKDLFVEISFYDWYENEPPDPGSLENDYGISTSVGYKF